MNHLQGIPFPQDFVLTFSAAPGLDVTADSVAGVAVTDEGAAKLVIALKAEHRNRKTGESKIGIMSFEVPVRIGHKPTVEELQAAGKPLWGLVKLGGGVWKLWGGPVRFTERDAGYVTVVECPDPAPWEKPLLTLVGA